MTEETKRVAGQCSCGGVRYEVRGPLRAFCGNRAEKESPKIFPDEKKVEVFAAFRNFKRNRKKPVSASGYPSSWGGSGGEAAEEEAEEVEEKASETTKKVKEKATKSKSKKLKKWIK